MNPQDLGSFDHTEWFGFEQPGHLFPRCRSAPERLPKARRAVENGVSQHLGSADQGKQLVDLALEFARW